MRTSLIAVCLTLVLLQSGTRGQTLNALPLDAWPDFQATLTCHRDLQSAIDRSIAWFNADESKRFFPSNGITHDRASRSLVRLRELIRSQSGDRLMQSVRREFRLYQSVGSDGQGTVTFTGYYNPLFKASRTKHGPYQWPLYKTPADLEYDHETTKPFGRKVNERFVPYYTRSQIENEERLKGTELVWLADPFDAFVIQVNGSAALELSDGGRMFTSHTTTNGLTYTSVGKLLIADGKIPADKISMQAIRDYFVRHPDQLKSYLHKNDRYVFFRELSPDDWPKGAMGIKLTPIRSIATDKRVFPRGGAAIVDTSVPTIDGKESFVQLVLDQDTGGAIIGPGRTDIYMGVGDAAGERAGRMIERGRLFYLFLRD